ncbi:MAG: SRPBCC family protein [Alphaproteobacteria bacterium]|nr:SRPBCC family protein [Alphaproteobacteria bacterium]
MRISNVHRRDIAAPHVAVGALIDGLASPRDALWPRDRWPAVRFDRPLGVGAVGGHGPVSYAVEAYEPGRWIVFRFTPAGRFSRILDGTHALDVEAVDAATTRLWHRIEARARRIDLPFWWLVVEPLHDALIEDAFDRAERAATGRLDRPARWSPWVRLLRRLLGRP